MEHKNKLITFLKERGVLEKFKANMRPESNITNVNLKSAFVWQDTSEGADFWANIYDDYQKMKEKEMLKIPTKMDYLIAIAIITTWSMFLFCKYDCTL